MRIALITPGFSASERDWCIPALLNLVRELAREHNVTVFTLRYPHLHGTYHVYGATVHAFGGAETSGAGRLRLLLRATRRVLREHRESPFDVIHAFWADEPGFIAATVRRLTGVPAVVSVIGGEMVRLPDIEYGGRTNRLNRPLTALALRGASRVTVGSRYLADLASGEGISGNVKVMPLGIDPGMFNPEEPTGGCEHCLAGSPALLSVGSLVPVKDHRTLLRALPDVIQSLPNAHVHILGDGPLRPELEELAASLGLLQHVTFHGEIEHHDLPGFYRAGDLLIASSRHESQGLAALEAAACGCPVIGTAVGVVPDLTPAQERIQPDDPDALAPGIITAAADPECRRHLRRNQLDLVCQRFTLDRTVPALLALYADALASR